MSECLQFSFAFYGSRADSQHELDMYDAAQALLGFQRSLALTSHLILNDQIITQAPSLKGASIYLLPPEAGSWKATVNWVLAATATYNVLTAAPGTPLGHLVHSGYDYVISETLGFHVDYDKSLGQQYQEMKRLEPKLPELTESRFSSLIEKCEPSIREMHRPIYARKSASRAIVTSNATGTERPIGGNFTLETFQHIAQSVRAEKPEVFEGSVTSYNSNTFKGRVFILQSGFPVPFELADGCRGRKSVRIITESLSVNAQREPNETGAGTIYFRAHRITSHAGRLKKLEIVQVSESKL